MSAPLLDYDARLLQRIEDLTVEQLVAHTGIEALDVAVLPGRAWFDIGRLGANGTNPVSDLLGDELRSLSDRMYSGGPRRMNRSVRTSTTSVALSLRAARIINGSFVNSSMTLRMR